MSTPDIIDTLAGIKPGSALDGIRARRLQARENAQKSYLSLFEPIDAADFVNVTEALRGKQRAGRALALENRVDGDRRAVQEKLRRREACGCFSYARFDAVHQPRRRGQRLAEPQMSGLFVERRHVREGAADVGG